MEMTLRQAHQDVMDDTGSQRVACKLSRKDCAIDKVRSRFIIAITGDSMDGTHCIMLSASLTIAAHEMSGSINLLRLGGLPFGWIYQISLFRILRDSETQIEAMPPSCCLMHPN